MWRRYRTLSETSGSRGLCVDEKRRIQTLEGSQVMLPLRLGYGKGVTQDTIRNGTTLFAALDVATGKLLAQCKHRRRHPEFLPFR